MMLWELVRKNEARHVTDTTEVSTASDTWAVLKSYTISIDVEKALVWYIKPTFNSVQSQGLRAKVNGQYFFGLQGVSALKVVQPRWGLVYLQPGTYNVIVEGRHLSTSSTDVVKLTECRLGSMRFSDDVKLTKSASQSVGAGTTLTVINENVTIPAKRRIALGYTKRTVVKIDVVVISGNDKDVTFRNPTEGNGTDALTVRLKINDSYVAWKERYEHEPQYYGAGTQKGVEMGSYWTPFDVSDSQSSFNVKVEIINTQTASDTAYVYVNVYGSPWLLYDSFISPVDLLVTFGSTIYIISEPLVLDPTKEVRIGWEKAVDRATDVYYSQSGTGILVFNYTFDVWSPTIPDILKMMGWGASVMKIAADIRG